MSKKTQPKSKAPEGTTAAAQPAKLEGEPAKSETPAAKSTPETPAPSAKTPRLSPSLRAKAQQIIAAREKKQAPAKGARAPKPPKTEEEDLVVFAFRLSQEERELIHKAAGPAKASRFVRALAVAAAKRDETAVRKLLATVS